MVKVLEEEEKWILRNTNIDPLKVADAFGVEERDCWEYLIQLWEALREAENAYDPIALQMEVRAWVQTIPDHKNIRINAIREQLIDAKTNPQAHDVDKLIMEVKYLKGTEEKATPEMIARAKEYPLEQLLDTKGKKGNISCPFHKDRTPSFQIKKNNTWTCYSCGEYGDSISLYQKLNNTSFLEAVRKLQ